MKHLVAAATVLLAAPAMAEPVDLVCEGTQWSVTKEAGVQSWLVSGIRVTIHEDKNSVVVAGTKTFSATYLIDPKEGDSARIEFFLAEKWRGAINRYSGRLALEKCTDDDCKSFDQIINATCGKADPLF